MSFWTASQLAAIELEIRFPLLEKQLAQALFTQDGKRYVKGNAKSRCNFAYLADPKFSSRDGRLVIKAKFSGNSSVDVFGRCVGFADSFDLEIVGGLTTKDGTLVLAGPQVTILSKDTFYSRQVQKALRGSVVDAVKYPLRDEIRKLLSAASASGPYKVTIGKVEIRSLELLSDALLVEVDTRFVVE